MSAPLSGFDLCRVHASDASSVIDVLCEAFADYPVMRYVLETSGDEYTRHLHRLIEFFVMARVLRGEPLLGVMHEDDLVATATISFPVTGKSPPALGMLREDVWRDLGPDPRARYETCGQAWAAIEVGVPHIHLNMVGVRPAFQGRGLARRLLDEAQEISRATPDSQGVMLLTEGPRNVAFYQHVGYETIGHVGVTHELESWGMFRRN